MQTNGICTHCGKKIRFGISLCRECENIKRNSLAMISQNKKKLKKLLEKRTLTIERFEKFILYSNNIIHYGKILMEYKEKDTMRAFDKVMKFGSIILFAIIMFLI